MKRKLLILIAVTLTVSLLLPSCSPYLREYSSHGEEWSMGFGAVEIALPEDSEYPLYIAGYKNGVEIDRALDLPRASAVWIDTGESGSLLIGIDCIACGSGTVQKIRDALSDFCRETGCASVNVYATHTHAGADTLGLWGPVAIDGKNPDYMENLTEAAVSAAKLAYEDRSVGKLTFGSVIPEDLLHDSREPVEYDPTLYQIRFSPSDSAKNGIRMISYSAHAESLRGDNTKLSRDFPGALADRIYELCGDDVMFMPGAVGGLIMTRELTEPFDAEENMNATADLLAEAVTSIENEETLEASFSFSSTKVKLPLDNTFFFFGKFLGILDNKTSKGESETGYLIHTEVGVMTLGSVTLALIPGEIFPELVSGNGLKDSDPEPLAQIAKRYGAEKLLVVGLCNDEIGYIVPPSNFLLNEELPFIEPIEDHTGENHYEETNSVGVNTAELIAKAFEKALGQLP